MSALLRHSRRATAVAIGLAASIALGDARFVESEEDEALTIIRLEVTPADEPSPAFEHRLSYSPNERLPGNRPQWYVRLFPENTAAVRGWRELISGDEYDDVYRPGVPLSSVPIERFEEGLKHTRVVDDFVVAGAQRRDCDWGVNTETLSGAETYEFLLPEFQSMRELARMTMFRTRHAVATERYQDAVTYLRAQYQLGRDVGAEPIIVPGLIGIAIVGIANQSALDLVAAPGAPNLYWAFTELPSNPVPLRDAVQNELSIGERIYPFLDDPEHADRTPEEWNALWKRHASKVIADAVFLSGDLESHDYQLAATQRAVPTLSGLLGYRHAKERLIDWGFEPDEVEAMAVGQVLSIYSARIYRTMGDEFLKAYLAPYTDRARHDKSAEERLHSNQLFSDGPDREVLPFGFYWLPAVRAARTAEVRVARDLAALRVVEALRMHAAQNNGAWPATLDDVTCVPIPLNPATDKPFLYHRDGKTAVLELPEWEGFPGYSRRYEITIKRP